MCESYFNSNNKFAEIPVLCHFALYFYSFRLCARSYTHTHTYKAIPLLPYPAHFFKCWCIIYDSIHLYVPRLQIELSVSIELLSFLNRSSDRIQIQHVFPLTYIVSQMSKVFLRERNSFQVFKFSTANKPNSQYVFREFVLNRTEHNRIMSWVY